MRLKWRKGTAQAKGKILRSILRWVSAEIRRDNIKNDSMRERERVGVVSIAENMVEYRLKWFEHGWRRLIDSVVRRVY